MTSVAGNADTARCSAGRARAARVLRLKATASFPLPASSCPLLSLLGWAVSVSSSLLLPCRLQACRRISWPQKGGSSVPSGVRQVHGHDMQQCSPSLLLGACALERLAVLLKVRLDVEDGQALHCHGLRRMHFGS